MSLSAKTKCTNNLKEVRRRRGLLLRDVAKMIGHSTPSHLSHFEKQRKLPNLVNALKLSAAMKCPVEILFLDLFNQLRKETNAKRQKHNIELTFK